MLDAAFLDDFDAADPVAHGLPGEAYTSEAFAQLEREYLFSHHWIFVGYAHKLAHSGDVQPVQVGGLPLFLLRDRQQRVVAFHNVCRHRNLKLIDASGNCGKLIRCPYHSWSYDLCGQLRNAPYFGGQKSIQPPGFDYAENGLAAVNCEVWHDWVFVNLSPQPMPFDDFLAPIKRQLGNNDVADYVPVATLDLGEVPCNWKLLMENFIEPYHVQFVHRSTTEQPLENHYTVVDEHCLGSAVELSAAQVASARTGTLGVTSHYLALFPNFVMGTYQPDQMGVHLNEAVGAGLTRQQRVIYAHRDAGYSDAKIRQLSELWLSVHREDHEMCIRLQQGRHSPLSALGGVLSPHWESSVRKFQERVADAIRPGLVK